MGVAIILVLAVVAILVVRTLWRSLAGLENQVAAAIIAGSTTVLVSVLSVTGARFWERRNELERGLRAKKVPVYEQFIGGWLHLLLSSKDKGLDEDAAREFLISITPQLTIWASDDVVATWSRLRRQWTLVDGPGVNAPHAMQLMFEFESVLLKIRQDLGHSNRGLQRGDLLGLWVNDIDDYVAPQGSVSRVA